jgi:hypothetical protein
MRLCLHISTHEPTRIPIALFARDIKDLSGGNLLLAVMPIPAIDLREGIVASREPDLREGPHLEIIRSRGAAQLGG